MSFEKFYRIVSKIPKGKVATYQDVAKAAGIPGGARAVGNAMACNPDTKRVPCHRVVKSTGVVGGYMGDLKQSKVKAKKLIAEGVQVDPRTGKILNFQKARVAKLAPVQTAIQ